MVIYLSKPRLILVVLIVLVALLTTPTYSYINVKYSETVDTLTIKTYFTSISIDLKYSGIVKNYEYDGIEVKNLRYFGPGTIHEALYYEIIPSVTPVTGTTTITWPGEIFSHKATYKILENTPYKSVVVIKTKISDVYDAYLIKKYTFYYDKPYFDIEYIFVNNENIELKMDLSQAWLRATSFSIELASSFGGDAEDDFQICGTTDNKLYIHQGYSPGTLENLQGKVKFIALISHSSDYDIPQGIILIPQGDTVKYTLGVWYEIAGQGLSGVPHSSIIRLEMKALRLGAGSNTTFSYRVYMGPITYYLLSELNLQGIVVRLRTEHVQRIPDYIPEYRIQNEYKLTINIEPANKNLYPNATLNIYYVRENGSLELVENISLTDIPYTVTLQRRGLYMFEIIPETGFTLDGNHIYGKAYVNNMEISKAYIPVYRDVSITLTFEVTPVAWITILFVDENYYSLDIIRDHPITVEFRGENGYYRRYNITEPVFKIYLPPGTYTVTIKPSEVAYRKLTDVYLNNQYILYRTLVNETSFTVELKSASQNNLILRYINLKATRGGVSEFFLAIVIAFILVAILLAIMIVVILRGRRRI